MNLVEDLDAVAGAAARFADPGETLTAVVPTEPAPGRRTYLCAFDGPDGRTWLALDAAGAAVTSRGRVREAVSIEAACELVEETGDSVVEEPRIASPEYLDRLGTVHGQGVAAALGGAAAVAEELAREVESQYKLPLT